MTRAAARVAASKMIRARRAAVRYVSLGWLKPLESFQTVNKPLKPTSLAAKGGGATKANRLKHEARFWNAAPGAFEGEKALKQALSDEAANTAQFAARKMQQAANRHKA